MNDQCKEMREMIADCVLGILPQEHIETVDKHIQKCITCKQYKKSLEEKNILLVNLGQELDADMQARKDRALVILKQRGLKNHKEMILIWRKIMKTKIVKLTAAAVIFIAIIFGINFLDAPIDGASAAFAAAMDSIERARTFSCIQIMEISYEDDQGRGTYLSEYKRMFKEPDLERHEQLTSPWPEYVGEIAITDFSKRQQLYIRPAEKTAILYDDIFDYKIHGGTGELELRELDTSLRDRLLELSIGTFDDLGSVELDGQSVLMLQSEKNGRITTIWIDPKTNLPVQIELKWPAQDRSPVLYTSIEIDTELDDSLFSLELPEGYTLEISDIGWSDNKEKIGAKMKYLSLMCANYAFDNFNQFPDDLGDLVTKGLVTDQELHNLLTDAAVPENPPVILYHKPNTGGNDISIEGDWSVKVVLYETYDQWPDDGIVVCFADGHCEIITDQNLFEQLIE